MNKTLIIAGSMAVLLCLGPMALADALTGRSVGVTCNGCHGPDGSSKGAAPSLKGLPAAHLEKSMLDFKSGKRTATIMGRIAKGYSDEEIKAVAKYFADMK